MSLVNMISSFHNIWKSLSLSWQQKHVISKTTCTCKLWVCVCVCVYTCASVCTCFCHLGDIHSLLFGHEAQDGEHHEASKEAGAAVNQSQHEGIPATDQSNQLQIIVWAHTRARY